MALIQTIDRIVEYPESDGNFVVKRLMEARDRRQA
jgi:hypothetical protein